MKRNPYNFTAKIKIIFRYPTNRYDDGFGFLSYSEFEYLPRNGAYGTFTYRGAVGLISIRGYELPTDRFPRAATLNPRFGLTVIEAIG